MRLPKQQSQNVEQPDWQFPPGFAPNRSYGMVGPTPIPAVPGPFPYANRPIVRAPELDRISDPDTEIHIRAMQSNMLRQYMDRWQQYQQMLNHWAMQNANLGR